MAVVTRTMVRRKLVHTGLLLKIKAQNLPIDSPAIRARLATTREQWAHPMYGRYIDLWEQLIDTGDLDEITRIVLADDERGEEMRRLSPFTVYLTEEARLLSIRLTSALMGTPADTAR